MARRWNCSGSWINSTAAARATSWARKLAAHCASREPLSSSIRRVSPSLRRRLSFHSEQLILRILRENQSAELDFLRDFVRVELQAERTFAAEFRLWISPIGDELAIDDEPNARRLRENLHLIPVVLFAGGLGSAIVFVDAVAPVEIPKAPIRRKHHEMPEVTMRI